MADISGYLTILMQKCYPNFVISVLLGLQSLMFLSNSGDLVKNLLEQIQLFFTKYIGTLKKEPSLSQILRSSYFSSFIAKKSRGFLTYCKKTKKKMHTYVKFCTNTTYELHMRNGVPFANFSNEFFSRLCSEIG